MPFRSVGNFQWVNSNQVCAPLGLQDPPAKTIDKLRATMKLAVVTSWASFDIESLAHSQPIRLRDGDVTVSIDPVRQITRKGKLCWGIDIDLQNDLDASYHFNGMRLFSSEGKDFIVL